MTEKTRSTLYRGLMELVHDEEAVGEVLSYFPARDVEEPVTKDFLRAEMADLRTELRAEMADLRTELRAEMADLRTEVRTEMAAMRTDLERMVRTLQAWMVGTAISVGGLVVATGALVR